MIVLFQNYLRSLLTCVVVKNPRAASHGILLDDRRAAEPSCDKRATFISDTRGGSNSDDIETSKSLDIYTDRAAK